MTETALLILLAIIAVAFIFLVWDRSKAPTRSSTQRSGNFERPIHTPAAMAWPEVVIHYDIDIRDEPPLAREKKMTLRNSGAPAFKVQIQDIAYKNFVAKFPPVSEVTQGGKQVGPSRDLPQQPDRRTATARLRPHLGRKNTGHGWSESSLSGSLRFIRRCKGNEVLRLTRHCIWS